MKALLYVLACVAAGFAGVMLAAGLANAQTSPPSAVFASAFPCWSASTVDGDTLKCASGLRVRLWGVSAPEKREPGGAEAAQALDDLVGARDLACIPLGFSFDRVVARCWPLGKDVGEAMIRSGKATEDTRFSAGFYSVVR